MGGSISDMVELEKAILNGERERFLKAEEDQGTYIMACGDITESIIRSYENSTAFIFDLGYNPQTTVLLIE